MSVIQRDCPNCPDPCRERHRKIWDILNAERDAPMDGRKGLIARFAEQVAKGAQGPGTASWTGHTQAINNGLRELRAEIRRYKNSWNTDENGNKGPCPDTPLIAEAEKWAAKSAPTPAEWEANNPAEMSTLERVGWGAAGVVGIVVTGAAILSPFDGPAGDIVAGAATVEAWRRAIFGAGAVAGALAN